ncbi:uncharacterized protein LOC135626192 [Musa acuminata AAA Group]|uniref:(wild Malaysian banana) hypothetical protein n=2 Tax=Musa acuminata TaxID=4641 RepID=A0A804L3Y4_MUSAM|nr:PREDICTED: uncharacterized protein LOC103970351 [Musa acuminata subsp. malaccensis]CAG1863472.1 unnamed protein product [Musa acuminata subsp. malaccensis]
MENANTSSQLEEPMQQGEDSVSEVLVHNLSRRLEALEHSVRYLEDNMMTRLSAMEERVEELMRRMDGYNDLSRSWSQQVSLEVPTVSPNAPAILPSPPAAARPKKKQRTLIARRVIRRYQRLVKPSWDNKPFMRRVIKKIEKKRRQRS